MKNIIIIGSSSDISISFQALLDLKKISFFTISRSESNKYNHLTVQNYINDTEKIISFVNNIKNPTIIFFNGYLAENRDLYEPSLDEIALTDYVNFQVPFVLTKSLSINSSVDKFIYISSIASVKPRRKNFIYGMSKNKLEQSLKFLNLKSYLIIRFGKVDTKMSINHTNAPFSISSKQAATTIFNKLDKKGYAYGNLGVHLSRFLLAILPQKVINKF